VSERGQVKARGGSGDSGATRNVIIWKRRMREFPAVPKRVFPYRPAPGTHEPMHATALQVAIASSPINRFISEHLLVSILVAIKTCRKPVPNS